MRYLHLTSKVVLPEIGSLRPFKAVVIVEEDVTDERRREISRWLVASGCVYAMAWGKDCSAWDDSIDWANVDAFESSEIPDDCLVITTWHEKESLIDVFWFSKHTAMHPCHTLDNVLLLHLATHEREADIVAQYDGA